MKIARVWGFLVCVGVLGVCFGGRGAHGIKRPSARELLAEYGRTQDKLKSCITRTHSSRVFNDSDPKGELTHFYDQDFRWDGRRVSLTQWFWSKGSRPNEFFEKNDDCFIYRLRDGEKAIQYDHSGKDGSGDIVFLDYNRKAKADYIDWGLLEKDCFGYLGSEWERVDHILKGQEGMKVAVNTEYVQGMNCYVINAKVREGSYKLWICPERDYHAVKAMVRKAGGDIHKGEALPGGVKIAFSMELTDFKRMDGIWVPMAGKGFYKLTQRDGSWGGSEKVWTREEVIIDPDHEKLDSFGTSRIRNGAKVYLAGRKRTYIWRDGKVVDGEGKEVDIKAKVERQE